MKKILAVSAVVVLLASCVKEEIFQPVPGNGQGSPFRVVLRQDGFPGETKGAAPAAGYDRVEILVAGKDGELVGNIKSMYESSSSTVNIEGLYPGEYNLLVLGINGEWQKDSISIGTPSDISDRWFSFPETLDGPLNAEYFYSSTPFTVKEDKGSGGYAFYSDLPESITQSRIISRLDFSLSFNNRYVETSATSLAAYLDSPVFFRDFSCNGEFSGSTDGGPVEIDLTEMTRVLLPPTPENSGISGKIRLMTRNYREEVARRDYTFSLAGMISNTIQTVEMPLSHHDDESGTMFITSAAYDTGDHGLILQDDEPVSVYTDKAQRSFSTDKPLQVSVTDDGRLHVRFYSPRPLQDALIRIRIPSHSDEYMDIAYFEEIPAFADFYEAIPCLERSGVYRTEAGGNARLPKVSQEDLAGADFKVVSEDPYWAKLEKIKTSYTLSFTLHGGDPTAPDGGPAGNWMGIRPVHCREAVAFFLNCTYLSCMPEFEQLMKDNPDALTDDQHNKVAPETAIQKMQQTRTLTIGLVYPGNGVIGLASPSTYGVYQNSWFNHYSDTYACEIAFHELGHVLGYGHSSSFTYGAWAQKLMNNFYVNNLKNFPIDSRSYLNSTNNPNKY